MTIRDPDVPDTGPRRLNRHARGGSRAGRTQFQWNSLARASVPFASVAAIGFIVAWLIMAFVVFPGGRTAADIEIPSVIGLSYDEASQRLRSYGFDPVRGEARYDANAPIYTVVSQEPRAGELETVGASILLETSLGQQRAEVPMVMGMTRDAAEAALTQAGFELGEVTTRQEDAPRGQVVSTRPSIGSSVTLPAEVNLVVSAGPSTVELPDVTGQYLAEASQLLEQLGLRTAITWDSTSFMGQNMVLGQSPASGQRVRAGARVTLTVAGTP